MTKAHVSATDKSITWQQAAWPEKAMLGLHGLTLYAFSKSLTTAWYCEPDQQGSHSKNGRLVAGSLVTSCAVHVQHAQLKLCLKLQLLAPSTCSTLRNCQFILPA